MKNSQVNPFQYKSDYPNHRCALPLFNSLCIGEGKQFIYGEAERIELEDKARELAGYIFNNIPEGNRIRQPEAILTPVRKEMAIAIVDAAIKTLTFEAKAILIGAIALLGHIEDNPQQYPRLCGTYMSNDWLAFAARLANCSVLQLASILATWLKIRFEYIFNCFPQQNRGQIFNDPCISCYPKLIKVAEEIYKITGEYPLYDYNGVSIQKVVRYSCGNHNEYAFACNDSNSNWIMGKIAPVAYLHNYTTIENNPATRIILALNSDVLSCLLDFTQSVNLLDRANTIITGVFGGNPSLDGMSAIELHGHPVTLICSPDSQEYEKIRNVAKLCTDNGATSLHVCVSPIVGDHCWFHPEKISQNTQNKLRDMIIDVNTYELTTRLCKDIQDNSFPLDDLENWEIEVGLRIDKNPKKADSKQTITSLPWNAGSSKLLRLSAPQTFLDLFPFDQTMLIYGQTGTAKSYLAMDFGISLASGKGSLGLSSSTPVPVLYMDGEMGLDTFTQRVEQLGANLTHEERRLLNKNLRLLDKGNCKTLVEDYEVLNAFLASESFRIAIIDNISSLKPNARYDGKHFDMIADILKQHNCAPLFLHHTGKDSERLLGSNTLPSLSQNVFKITDAQAVIQEWIENKEAGSSPHSLDMEKLDKSINENSKFIQLTLEKTKIAPYWENNSIFMALPIGGTWEQLTRFPEVANVKRLAYDTSQNSESGLAEMIDTLTPDERKVWDLIMASSNGVKRQEIDEKCGWSESKSQEILGRLKKQGLIQAVGNAKGTFYIVNKQ